MLNTQQKSQILKKAGHPVPAMPGGNGPELEAGPREVGNLSVPSGGAGAPRSLRESEEARQLERLRRLAQSAYV